MVHLFNFDVRFSSFININTALFSFYNQIIDFFFPGASASLLILSGFASCIYSLSNKEFLKLHFKPSSCEELCGKLDFPLEFKSKFLRQDRQTEIYKILFLMVLLDQCHITLLICSTVRLMLPQES